MGLFLKNLVFTIVVPGTVAGVLPWALFGPYDTARGGTLGSLAGGSLILAGIALYVVCVASFAGVGGGTPAPIDAPVRLVVAGPYRVVRNPMYIAVLGVIFGQAILAASRGLALYGLGVALVFHGVVIGYEERALERRFGASYRAYRERVRRWVPRLDGDG